MCHMQSYAVVGADSVHHGFCPPGQNLVADFVPCGHKQLPDIVPSQGQGTLANSVLFMKEFRWKSRE